MSDHNDQLAELAAHMSRRRSAILHAWRTSVTSDTTLTTGASLPRAQLHDHIPALLVDFERRLAADRADKVAKGEDVQRDDAAAHGLHRWQQGFDLGEVTRELGRLNECVVVELDSYSAANPALAHGAMAAARRIWAQQHEAAIGASTSQFFRLQQIEASSHIQDLEHAMAALRELEQQRAQLWQQAAHDLRGNLGVVVNVTAGLTSVKASDAMRADFLRMLDRNVRSLRHLLDDVTGLARLQAGQEHRSVKQMDAAVLLRDVCEGLQAQAQERNLFLKFNGSPTLAVQGDPVKTRRIAQNLVLNAIKYTRQGGVTVTCGAGVGADAERWFFEVEDTGPGFHAGPGSQLAGALETATDQAAQVASDAKTGNVTHMDGDVTGIDWTRHDARPVHQETGEGIGLSIVKRLCDLLDASVEVESTVEAGTTLRVRLPRRYED
ncbi:MAG TPA: sensor histidine kinase [Burkholderiaceae bacterium]